MKSLIRKLMILIVAISMYQGCFSQKESELKKPIVLFSQNIEDESVPVSLSVFYGSEGWGGGVTFRFMESWKYQHFGIKASKEIPIDIFYGIVPVRITNSLMIKTDIGFGFKTRIDMRDLQKTLSTFGPNDGLVVYLSPGLLFQFGRFEINVDYQIGQLFSKGFVARWRQMYGAGFSFGF